MTRPTENALAIIGPQQPKTTTDQPKTDQPLPLDAPAMHGFAESITIDLTAFETKIGSPESDAGETAAPASGKSFHWEKFSPLAASLALATMLGILAGTAATVTLLPDKPAATAALPNETLALQERVATLSGDLTALKTGLESANRNSATQLNRIGERLDRAEKAQAEPAAKLARIMESLDRLERRTASAAPLDVTGSVTSIEKHQSKPSIEGWRLRDFYAGRAVLQSRTGTLYEVGPGSNLPGVGKVETIRRVDGKVVITTPNGVITSALEPPRRPPYHLPPGY